MPSPRAVEIVLSEAERAQLEAWTRRRTSAQALAQRSRIVLAAAAGTKNTQIAAELGVSRPMVTKWRSRFAAERLEGLLDEPRPGRPRTIADAKVEEVIVRTLETVLRLLHPIAPFITALWIRPWAALAHWLGIVYEPALLLGAADEEMIKMMLHGGIGSGQRE